MLAPKYLILASYNSDLRGRWSACFQDLPRIVMISHKIQQITIESAEGTADHLERKLRPAFGVQRATAWAYCHYEGSSSLRSIQSKRHEISNAHADVVHERLQAAHNLPRRL